MSVRREEKGGGIDFLTKFLLYTFLISGLICLPLGLESWCKTIKNFIDDLRG